MRGRRRRHGAAVRRLTSLPSHAPTLWRDELLGGGRKLDERTRTCRSRPEGHDGRGRRHFYRPRGARCPAVTKRCGLRCGRFTAVSPGIASRVDRSGASLSPVSSRDDLQGGCVELVIRQERAGDHEAVREVHRQAFGDGERVPTLVDALRTAQTSLAPLSLVATVGERVVGHVMLSACRLDALPRLVDVLSLSPLGVRPEFQRQGIGTRLVADALAGADSRGIPLVFLEGSPHYYGKRGFATPRGWAFVHPHCATRPALFRSPGCPHTMNG